MKDLSWKAVVLVSVVVAGLVCLTLAGRDTTVLGGIAGLILAGLGFTIAQQHAVKEQTNGNTTRLMDIIEAQGKMLATSTPAPIEGTIIDEHPDTLVIPPQ